MQATDRCSSNIRYYVLIIVVGLFASTSHRAAAADRCAAPSARLVSASGIVEHKPRSAQVWRLASLNQLICLEDELRTGPLSRAAIIFLDTDSVLRIDQNTLLRIKTPPAKHRSLLELLRGVIQMFSRTPKALEVETPFVNAAVEGTEFLIRVERARSVVTVFEGRIVASNEKGSITLGGGESAIASDGRAPRADIPVRPRDAVQWALFYPPILFDPAQHSASAAVREAAQLLLAGRADRAIAVLDSAPKSAPALGLRAVISIAQNRNSEALRLGRAAVALDPESGAAALALSYALQANFDLKAAQKVMADAVTRIPGNAFAWARLAELLLSTGRTTEAMDAAAKAAEISSDISRMNTVLGFAALSRISVDEAKAAFRRAIGQDSQDPLPRFGLGLSMIRGGDLAGGRRQIEIAAALDPGNALIRSYLGKAYFEEVRKGLDAAQFKIAKALDPHDPTPFLYDAIRKQIENRPIEALRDLERSIALNDNRAIYRSRQLLDEDAATRGASLARIYGNLGFDLPAVVESSRSLALDPGNHSAHRFLSDSYAMLPRHEIARGSELLRSQLLQPASINPVQPSLPETDLNILTGVGPGATAFNEYTPAFMRDRVQLTATGLVGNNSTFGDEVVVSAIHGPASFSAGQFHFESDGFRVNNDLRHNIYNAFAQVSLTDWLDVQGELRKRKSDQGDLRLNFDPQNFSTFDRRKTDQDVWRVGAHAAPAPGHDFLASMIRTSRRLDIDQFFASQGAIQDTNEATRGYDLQGQYIYGSSLLDVAAGFGYYQIDVENRTVIDLRPFFGGACPFFFPTCDAVNQDSDSLAVQRNLYVYANLHVPDAVIWTLGMSYDDFRQSPIDVGRLNPKLGVQWRIRDGLRLRAAYIRGVKRALLVDQTLEPTQVAGFNQFFDDFDGSKTTRYGIGLDAKIISEIFAGVEASKRRVVIPSVVNLSTVVEEDQDEELYRAYLHWTPGPRWAVSAEAVYETFENTDQSDATLPINVRMVSLPVTLRYFHPSGLFGVAGATVVRQKVRLGSSSTFPENREEFALVDLAVGFRLPKRLGIVSVEIRNLLDKEFLYQDSNIQNPEPSNPRFTPHRTIMGRATLRF